MGGILCASQKSTEPRRAWRWSHEQVVRLRGRRIAAVRYPWPGAAAGTPKGREAGTIRRPEHLPGDGGRGEGWGPGAGHLAESTDCRRGRWQAHQRLGLRLGEGEAAHLG